MEKRTTVPLSESTSYSELPPKLPSNQLAAHAGCAWPILVDIQEDAKTLRQSNRLDVAILHNYNVVMSSLRFEWDVRKAAANEKNHGVTFDDAKSVFSDDHARLIDDPDHSENEDRFVLLGMASSGRLLLVCHCYRLESQVIRIISARKANRTESKFYRGR